MQIKVRVVTNAKKERIISEGDVYKIYVSAPPEKGKANKKIIELVADYFKVKKSSVSIISGLRSKEKTIKIFT